MAVSTKEFFAHQDQSLVRHLVGVAQRAKEFGNSFGAISHRLIPGTKTSS